MEKNSKEEVIYDINSISDLKEKGFIDFRIPLYQRKYAWGSDEVKVLLDDLVTFQEKKLTDQEKYYIGNIVVEKHDNKDEKSVYHIIDGQQRFTTIYLMLKLIEKSYFYLDYSIRDEDSEFLKKFIINDRSNIEKEVKDFQADKQFQLNLNTIFDYLSDKDKKLDYLLELLELCKFTITVLPEDVDIVKYFEVMNNRGKQLEKHQILKAKFIDALKNNSEYNYAKIWDYCSNMNVYLDEQISYEDQYKNEKNIEEIRNSLNIFIDNGEIPDYFKKIDEDIGELTIIKIIKDKVNEDRKEGFRANNSYTSIVKFPVFLIQVLKLYLVKEKNNEEDLENYKVNERYLLDYYLVDNNKLDEELINPKIFILFLLKMRILFDKHIFKRDKDQHPVIYRHISSIKEEKNKILNLQLLFSYTAPQRITQDWISVALKWLSKDFNINNFDYERYYKILIEMDRNFSKTRLDENIRLIEQINYYLRHEDYLSIDSIDKEQLNKKLSKGVSTPHYWFYKLDYLLWENDKLHNLNIKNTKFSEKENFKYKDIKGMFRLSQLNSIEHIFPQSRSDEWGSEDNKRKIDCFGNLALISNHMNSSLSNVNENKKTKIQMQLDRGTIESLKILLIYSDLSSSNDWNKDKCDEHQEKMINILYEDINK